MALQICIEILILTWLVFEIIDELRGDDKK